MNEKIRKNDADLNEAISALRKDEPAAAEVRAAGDRVWARMNATEGSGIEHIRGCADVEALLPTYHTGELSAARSLVIEDHLRHCVECRNLAHAAPEQPAAWTAPVNPASLGWGLRKFAMAAGILLVVGLSALFINRWFFAVPTGMRAKVQSVDGTLYRVSGNGEAVIQLGEELAEGETVRTGPGAHAFVQLRDGSVVEMNERAEFSVTAGRRDTTVHLDQGRILVQAAKRRTGHLYVLTPDARVSVTGTVFSVNAGMKGSRVAVVEGEVRVAHAGINDVLHAGDQVATSASMTAVPVRDEIAWSRNLDKHLALLAQFAKLQHKFEQIQTPGLRYSSAILARVPADTMVFASIPNLGEALNEANRVFQEQLQQSSVLREWWNKGKRQHDGMSFEEVAEKVHVLGEYLGDEVALVALAGQGGESEAVIIAEVRRPGLRDFLQSGFSKLGTQSGGLRVVDERQLTAMSTGSGKEELLALVGPDFVLFSSSPRSLQRMNAQLNAGASTFMSTPFGERVSAAYRRGAGFLIAVNLQQMISQEISKSHGSRQRQQRDSDEFQRMGFSDARFLIAEHRDLSGVPDNRAVIDFATQRRGIASWLASPSPMGSLEYVSANAGMAFSFVVKSPALMMDDLVQIASAGDNNSRNGFAEAESKLGIDFRDDLAACFGGDVTFALDGPILPQPSWKVIAQVYDPTRLQSTLERLTEAINREAAQDGKPGVQMERHDVNGRTYYVLRTLAANAMNREIHYTFAGGYMIAAPSRALVVTALRTKENNGSLARSGEFLALLPKDEHANFSAVWYQNMGPVVKPIASQLSATQLQALQEIAAETKPTVICAYGDDTQIEIASGTRLFPFDLNRMAISALIGGDAPARHH